MTATEKGRDQDEQSQDEWIRRVVLGVVSHCIKYTNVNGQEEMDNAEYSLPLTDMPAYIDTSPCNLHVRKYSHKL